MAGNVANYISIGFQVAEGLLSFGYKVYKIYKENKRIKDENKNERRIFDVDEEVEAYVTFRGKEGWFNSIVKEYNVNDNTYTLQIGCVTRYGINENLVRKLNKKYNKNRSNEENERNKQNTYNRKVVNENVYSKEKRNKVLVIKIENNVINKENIKLKEEEVYDNNESKKNMLKILRYKSIERNYISISGIGILHLELNENEKYYEVASNTHTGKIEKLDYISSTNSDILIDSIELYNRKNICDIKNINGIIATNNSNLNVIDFNHEVLKVQLVDYSIAAIIGYYYSEKNDCSNLENIPDGIYTVFLPLKDKMEMRMVKVEDKCIDVIEKYTTSKYSHFNGMKYLKKQLGITTLSDNRFYKHHINIYEDFEMKSFSFDVDNEGEECFNISFAEMEHLMKDYYNDMLNIQKQWIDIHKLNDKEQNIIYLNHKFIDVSKHYMKNILPIATIITSMKCEWICVGAAALANGNILKDYIISKL